MPTVFQALDKAKTGFALHLSFHRLSSYSLMKGITPKIRMLGFVLINSVLLNLLCVWKLYSFYKYAAQQTRTIQGEKNVSKSAKRIPLK